MDLFLIPLFTGACILFVIVLSSLLLFAFPIRCVIAFSRNEDRTENIITVSWTLVAIRFSRSGGTSTTRVLILGKGVYSRTEVDDRSRDHEPPITGPAIYRADIARHILPAIKPLGRFGLAVFRQVGIEEVSGKVRIGLGDPVATGMLYGGYWASRFAMNASRIFVVMEPVFDCRVIECDLVVRLKLRHPLVILIEAVSLSQNPDVRTLMTASRPVPHEGAKT
jgi:hypothetical protein